MLTPSERQESFAARHRRPLALALWIAGALLTVLLYYVTMPRPVRSGTTEASAGVPTIQVGALPVT